MRRLLAARVANSTPKVANRIYRDSVENTKVGVWPVAGPGNNLETVWCTERNTKFRLLTAV